jgi:hypothetical protein
MRSPFDQTSRGVYHFESRATMTLTGWFAAASVWIHQHWRK